MVNCHHGTDIITAEIYLDVQTHLAPGHAQYGLVFGWMRDR